MFRNVAPFHATVNNNRPPAPRTPSLIETWRCLFVHCREMTQPSRSPSPFLCNFCGTPKGQAAPHESETAGGGE